MSYSPFPLEAWITKLYKNIGIYEPHQLDINYIAKILGIHLIYSEHRCYSAEISNLKIININNKLNFIKQREVFFHELCHLLRHYGYQYKVMPKMFLELQEWDAQRFVRYASIPYHMLEFINLHDQFVIEEMVSAFKVSPQICHERLEQIKNRSYDKFYTYYFIRKD